MEKKDQCYRVVLFLIILSKVKSISLFVHWLFSHDRKRKTKGSEALHEEDRRPLV